ncbi:hypothetical protein ACEPAG_7457 [Sanghuangporus baumii]
MSSHFQPERPVGNPPGILQQIRKIVFGSWLNVLLLLIPVSWAMHFAKPGDDMPIFITSFLAIIPLAQLLSFATDEMSMRVGQTLAGLLNATLGNAVELIVAIIAIIKCELEIVQSSLVGSILSNLLLVLGMCFFAGGMRFQEQGFGASASQINASLLTLSVVAVLLPAAFHFAVEPESSSSVDPLSDPQELADIEKLSHGVAIVLLFIYASYLVFQLWSHASLYTDNHDADFKSTPHDQDISAHAVVSKVKRRFRRSPGRDPGTGEVLATNGDSKEKNGSTVNGNAINGSEGHHSDETYAPNAADAEGQPQRKEDEDEETETPSLSFPVCIGLLAVVTVLVAVTAEFLVDSIDKFTTDSGISKQWVGLILLPIVGNAAEHVTAVTVSVKDKLTLSIGVAVGSSIQIALFVIPLMVVIAWGLGKPLLLLFDPFESVTLFLAVLTVNYVVQDGKSNWLEGMILMCLYVIIAVSFWFYPGR